jgi:protein-disulfide isomerase
LSTALRLAVWVGFSAIFAANDQMAMIKDLVKANGFAHRPDKAGARTIYVFSDPFCPYCQALDASLAKLPEGVNIEMIPVAFKEGSGDVAAAALCDKKPAEAWRKYVEGKSRGEMPPYKACQQGGERVMKNIEGFVKLGLSVTPTIIADNGMVTTGSGTPQELMQWIEQKKP